MEIGLYFIQRWSLTWVRRRQSMQHAMERILDGMICQLFKADTPDTVLECGTVPTRS